MSDEACDPPSHHSSESYVPKPEPIRKKLEAKRRKIIEKHTKNLPTKLSCSNLIPKKTIPSENQEVCLLCHENDKKRAPLIQEWGRRMFNNNIETVDETMSRINKEFVDICEMNLEFEKNYKPWYIEDIQKDKIPMYNRIFSQPNLILCLDPGFNDYQKLMKFIEHGIRFFHLNLSKGTRLLQIKTINFLNRVKNSLPPQRVISIVAQISDSKLETGGLKYGVESIYLDRDSRFVLTAIDTFYWQGTHEIVYASIDDYVTYLDLESIIGIGDEILLEIVAIEKNNVGCIVKQGGLLKPNMEITVPGKMKWMQTNISNIEELDINFAVRNDCNYIVCPRADKIKLCQYVKWVAASQKKSISVLGKLHPKTYSADVIKSIFKEYHGIWIKDDLVAMTDELEELIYEQAKLQNKPIVRDGSFITSSHIKLRSLELKKYYLLFPNCLVFHVNGKVNPLQIKYIIRENYPDMNKDLVELCCKHRIQRKAMPVLLARYIALETLFRKVACVMCMSTTGRLAILLANNCVVVPIISIVTNITVARKLLLWRNVLPLMYTKKVRSWSEELNDRLSISIKYCKDREIIFEGSSFIVTFPSSSDCRHSDTFRLLTLNRDNCEILKLNLFT